MGFGRVIVLLACLGAVPLAAPRPSPCGDATATEDAERSAVAKAIDSSIGWFANKDFDRLYGALADDPDLFIFHPDSKSTIRGAAAFREFSRVFADTAVAYAGHQIRDLKIDLSRGRDVAWWSALLEDCSKSHGRKSCWHNCRWTGVAEKRDGRWAIAQMHFSFAEDQVASEAVERTIACEYGDYTEMRALVGELFAAEKYAQAAAILAGAVARYPDHVLANTFNLAAAHARLDQREQAVRALEDGLARGVFYDRWSLQSATWDSLRARPDFQRFLAQNEERRAAKQSVSAMKLEVVTPVGYRPERFLELLKGAT